MADERKLAARRQFAARRRLLTWRNLGFAFVAVLAAWGAVAAGWLLLGGRLEVGEGGGTSAAVSATRVAVLPFSVRGSEELTYLGEGMVDLLSTALDGAGELRVVDPYALMRFLKSVRDGPLDPETGEAVASRFGAGRFVLGSVVEAGGRLQVNASLYDADGRVEISAEEKAEDEGEVFDLVNNVARQLLAAGVGGPSARLTQVAAATTNSLPALAYDEGDSQEALRLLEQARPDDRWALAPRSSLLSQAHERYLRAQALEALGRDEEALDWYASLGWVPAEIFRVAPALLRRAEIYERLGDPEKAALQYRRFITRWRNCDPELRPAVDAAEQTLLRLTEQ